MYKNHIIHICEDDAISQTLHLLYKPWIHLFQAVNDKRRSQINQNCSFLKARWKVLFAQEYALKLEMALIHMFLPMLILTRKHPTFFHHPVHFSYVSTATD